MVRAGEGGHLIEEFAGGIVTVGWHETLELNDHSQRDLRLRLAKVYPDSKPGTVQNIASVLWRFSHEVKVGDNVVTYDPTKREYLLGEVTGDYRYDGKRAPRHAHLREVKWLHRVSRDVLSVATRNSLGSTLTLFLVPEEAAAELHGAVNRKAPPEPTGGLDERKDQLQQANRDVEEQSRELIEDRILALDPYELQDLIAAILRAMGYRTRVSPPGSDRGVDVLASPDGLGLQEPRIKVEVKHRPGSAMGAPDVRSFVAGLRTGDKGLYVSTGGFSREAKYEAERAPHPTTLIDLAELASLVTDNYDQFDPVGRALLPLKRIYRPLD
jgi:restriction system protein